MNAIELTPKQYHLNRLAVMAKECGVSLAEVKRMYDDEGGRNESAQEWVDHVRLAFKAGEPLPRKTLDNLERLRPGAVMSFWHDYPNANVPAGYQLPFARKR